MTDLLITEPFSAVPALLVLLLVVVVVVREVRLQAGEEDAVTRRLTWAVRVLAPLSVALLAARLLALG